MLSKQQKPTTTSVEYQLMRMSWLKNCGHGNESWQCLGTALRQAQEIDLHQVQEDATRDPGIDIGHKLVRLWEVEHRKRVWARIFIMDSHMAIALGRPRGIHREDCSTSVPIDCEYPQEPSRAVPTSTNHSREPPNVFTPVMFSIALGHKYHDLMSLRASKLDLRDYSKVENLHNDVEILLTNLPPALRPSFPDTTWDCQMPHLAAARQRLLTTANIFLLALHRPYVSTHMTSRNAAIKSAFAILQAQQELFTIVPQAHTKLYGYSFYTIDAGIFLAATLIKDPTFNLDTKTSALHELRQARIRLSCMKDRSVIARTGEVILQRCCGVIEANTPSPSSIASHDYAVGAPQMMNPGTVSFLQEFGCHVPDQATRELMSLLGEPKAAMKSSMGMTPPSHVPYYDVDIATFDPSSSNDFLYSDLTTDDRRLGGSDGLASIHSPAPPWASCPRNIKNVV